MSIPGTRKATWWSTSARKRVTPEFAFILILEALPPNLRTRAIRPRDSLICDMNRQAGSCRHERSRSANSWRVWAEPGQLITGACSQSGIYWMRIQHTSLRLGENVDW